MPMPMPPKQMPPAKETPMPMPPKQMPMPMPPKQMPPAKETPMPMPPKQMPPMQKPTPAAPVKDAPVSIRKPTATPDRNAGGNTGGNNNGGNKGKTTTAAAPKETGKTGGNNGGNKGKTTTAAAPKQTGKTGGNNDGNKGKTTTAAAPKETGKTGGNNGGNKGKTTSAAAPTPTGKTGGNNGGNKGKTTTTAAAPKETGKTGGNTGGNNGGNKGKTTTSAAAPAATVAPPTAPSGKINAALGINKASGVSPDAKQFCNLFRGLPTLSGAQVRTGGCSLTAQGAIPVTTKMPSTLILEPRAGSTVKLGTDFTIRVNVANLETGHFSDPQTAYYTSPQTLNDQGVVQGHTHVTIQRLSGVNNGGASPAAPDPRKFDFFKGVNNAADGSGNLEVQVPGAAFANSGPGVYRLCTMSSAFTHQPLVMPVAQRGAQDDCVRFTVA
ncbi:hypothetical protein HDU86_003441 [Geranomyces michiganensis]|nr:hypothetical protein HDU86_003441 [Geranomyces michiganensis]